ncbi:unnamed protein product, partial [Gongylonema pulchrum]|uniref:TYR_PHOSPHATASE_2 domain-containing protein n=1 Tax=Gongylonema pulchrum TaxID=637853 RepID=A0A183EUW3_9BILA
MQRLVHIGYYGWPDHCPADSPAVCREVLGLVHKFYAKKPIIVHCSAGIGRTGTFVAVEMAMEKLRKQEVCSIADIAKRLRQQRMHAIQNDM